jgi:hypothetical protein
VEAICRVADVVSPPTRDELQHFFRFNDELRNAKHKFYHYMVNLAKSPRQIERRRIPLRASCHFQTSNSRPLGDKLPMILDLVQVCIDLSTW